MNFIKDLDLEALEQEGALAWAETKQLMIDSLGVYYREGPKDNYTSLQGLLCLIQNNFLTYSISNLQEILCWLDVISSTIFITGDSNENLKNCIETVNSLKRKIIPMIILSYNIQSDITDEYNSNLYFPIETFTIELVDGGIIVINTDKYGKIKISGQGRFQDMEEKHKLLNLRTIIPQDTWDKVRNNNYTQKELDDRTCGKDNR